MSILKKFGQLPLNIKLCLITVAVFLAVVIFCKWLMPYDPNATLLAKTNRPPVLFGGTWAHPLGTDQIGRDVLSRIIYGLRTSSIIALSGLFIGCAIGVGAGLISGYAGGPADKIISVFVDFQFAVPNTLVILIGIVLFGTDMIVMMLFIGLAKWESYARMTRSLVLSIKHNQYVEAAQASGATDLYIVFRHILPNMLPTILVMMTLFFPSILTMESSLSFLGIGIQPPAATLGRMVGDGRNYLFTSWWISITPAVVILFMSLMIQTLGDWLRSSLNLTDKEV